VMMILCAGAIRTRRSLRLLPSTRSDKAEVCNTPKQQPGAYRRFGGPSPWPAALKSGARARSERSPCQCSRLTSAASAFGRAT
jgi:hypothetical protein